MPSLSATAFAGPLDVSVVLPFRNAASWLPQTLASLRQQEGVAIELIAVDDGSCDGSAELVQELWQDCPWPLRLIQLEGQGVSAARNRGWRAARAPVVAFLDADDLCLPGRLQGQALLLQHQPELAHCMCGWLLIDAEGRQLQARRPWLEGAGFDPIRALRHKVVLPSAWMLRHSVLEAMGGFAESLTQAEDVDLLLRLALAGQQGAWWQALGCAYRQHPDGASRHGVEQIRSLLWVTSQHLGRLPDSPATRALRREVLYTTRAWTGWKAWVDGEAERALELWQTALALSPLPAPLSWVHLAENVARSHQRQGLPFTPETLLTSEPWRQLEARWLQGRRERPWAPRAAIELSSQAPRDDLSDEETWALAWQALGNGRQHEGLVMLKRQLLRELGAEPERSPWWPQRLLEQPDPNDPLGALRARVLRWCDRLLALEAGSSRSTSSQRVENLVEELAELLRQWTWLCWPEDPRASTHHLARSLAIKPEREGLLAMGRAQQAEHPTGAAALRQLAEQRGLAAGNAALPPAAWERAEHQPDRCSGPACRPCQNNLLALWRQEPLAPGCVRWRPPEQSSTLEDPPFQLHRITDGQAWIRQPPNPWGTTHGLGVASGEDPPLPQLSRRYPQPWSSCPTPPEGPEPRPSSGQPLQLNGPVLAVADLCAEIYFHWLLEALPRIGLALDQLSPTERGRVRIWHNGGAAAWVKETLEEWLGLEPRQLIDAHQHPWVQAQQLIVPDFVGHCGWCSARAMTWLRSRDGLLDEPATPQNRLLWLRRGGGWRRPARGEEEVLRRLRHQGLKLEPVAMGALSVRQQAAVMNTARLVVVPHGGAMANLVFAATGTRVLEICNKRYQPPYLPGLAEQCKLDLLRCSLAAAPPRLYQDLLYESSALEPLELDDQLTAIVNKCCNMEV